MARRSVTIVASDGQSEDITWYDGTAGASVLRCAHLALGITAEGTANLLWKSGDIVDFDLPIPDGATLYLDTTATAAAPYSDDTVGAGRSRASRSPRLVRLGGGKGLPQTRVQPPDDDYGSTERVYSEDRWQTKPTASSLLRECLRRTLWGDSGTERSSEDERKPLISAKPWAPDHEEEQKWGSGNELSKGQRRTVVKMKRITADLSNERTYLSWMRAMLSMFSAGATAVVLAKKGGTFGTWFLVLGVLYMAISPCFLFIGDLRYTKVAVAMQGSVHETLQFYVGRDAYTINLVLSVLTLLTLGVISTEMMATV